MLRAIPPAPRRQAFAPIRLLLGLEDDDRQVQKTPLWLLILRAVAIAGAIVGFAQPVLNPTTRLAQDADGPLLLLMDQGWASAPDWSARQQAALAALDEAREAERRVLFWPLGDGVGEATVPPLAAADAVRPVLEGRQPAPWAPGRAAVLRAIEAGTLPASGQTIWLHDGLDHGEDGAGDGVAAALMAALSDRGPLRLIGPEAPAAALTPPRLEEGRLASDVLRAGGGADTIRVVAIAVDDRGAERRIAVADAEFAAGEARATALFDLPAELIRDVTRIALAEGPSAGGAAIATGAIRRVPVAIVDPGADSAIVSLTSASHYLRKAVEPFADVREGTLADMLEREPAALVLADHGALSEEERAAVEAFVAEEGGLLIRFAGPRLAASVGQTVGAGAQDPLLPVTLRRGGRVLGGALAWSSPRTLGPFAPDGIFRGLTPPDEVAVRTQVLAQPGAGPAGPGLGNAGGRHAAGHRQAARRRPRGAVPRERGRGVVVAAAIGAFCGDARSAACPRPWSGAGTSHRGRTRGDALAGRAADRAGWCAAPGPRAGGDRAGRAGGGLSCRTRCAARPL